MEEKKRFFVANATIILDVEDVIEFVRGALEGTRFTPPAPRAQTLHEKLQEKG